jgi:hypothetical protein
MTDILVGALLILEIVNTVRHWRKSDEISVVLGANAGFNYFGVETNTPPGPIQGPPGHGESRCI